MTKESCKNGPPVKGLMLSKGLTIFILKASLQAGPRKSGLLVKGHLLSKEQITLDPKVILPRVNLKNGLQEKEQML